MKTPTALWCLLSALIAFIHGMGEAKAAERAFDLRHVTIWSDGTRMAGDLYVPRDGKE